jgi:hypothetical protein
MRPIGCPETSVTNYQSALRNTEISFPSSITLSFQHSRTLLSQYLPLSALTFLQYFSIVQLSHTLISVRKNIQCCIYCYIIKRTVYCTWPIPVTVLAFVGFVSLIVHIRSGKRMQLPFYYILRTPFTCCHVALNNLTALQGATEIRMEFAP